MQFLKLVVFVALANFLSIVCHGQNIRYLGIEDGLSNNTVTSIYKDHNGFLWFGTLDGLSQYDGYAIKKFRNKYRDTTTLPDDNIICINADASGDLWVGTRNGAAMLNSQNLRFSQLYLEDKSGTRKPVKGVINAICNGTRNQLFIASRTYGFLRRLNGHEAREIQLLSGSKSINTYSASTVFVSKNGNVWVGVDDIGLCKLNPISDQLEIIASAPLHCTGITENTAGNLFIGTDNGLFYYDTRRRRVSQVDLQEFTNTKINGVVTGKNRELYLATDGYGVLKIDNIDSQLKIAHRIHANDLTSNSVYTIFEDELSRKWIGTLRGGIDIIDDKVGQFKTIKHNPLNSNSLINDFTFSFCEDKNGDLWIATDGGGLSLWNRKTNTFENHVFKSSRKEFFNKNYITNLLQDRQKNIWLSTYGPGVMRYNFQTHTFEDIPFLNKKGDIRAWRLCMDQQGVIWAACLTAPKDTSSLYYFNPIQKRFEPAAFTIKDNLIAIANDGINGLWLGTFSGLQHVNKKNGVDLSINLDAPVRSIHISSSGLLWIGTYGRGLFSYQKATKKLSNYTEENGLCNNKVLNLEEDNEGKIWMSTHFGICKFDPIFLSFENFYAADGLQSNQFYFNASIRLASGELAFGGIKGFNIFSPEKIRRYHDFPTLIITDLRAGNTPIDATSNYVVGQHTFYNIDHIKLPYDNAVISLGFAALEYSMPEKIQYAYMLEGRDKTWNYLLNQRNLNFTQLDAGTYILKIRCTNSSGIWSQHVKRIKITITPPWYRTWWAYAFYVFIIASGLAAYVAYERKQTRLKFEMKLIREVNENKLSFFTNISHELRTPLTLILNPIKELLHSDGKNLDLIDISTVYRNSRRLLSLVDQLLLFKRSESEIPELKPAWINIAEVSYEVFLCFNNQVKHKNVTYEFCSEDVNIRLYADREKIDIILFNLLSNAIKYTSEHGKVRLILRNLKNSVEILIEDSGKGIPAEIGNKIFEKFYRINQESGTESGFGIGLYLANKYMEIHNGQLSYISETGKGTVFKMALPKPTGEQTNQTSTEGPFAMHTTYMVNESIAEAETAVKDDLHEFDDLMGSDIISSKQAVLLIDDDTDFRTYLKKILRKTYWILEAENAEHGFELLLENDPDIIVCDVLLKGMNGVEFCSKIKTSPSFSHIPVILLTGSSSPEIKLKGIECGADDYITKPFEKDLLIARIKSTLKGRMLLKKFFINEITLKQNQFKIPAEYSDFINKCIEIIEKHLENDDFSTKLFTNEIGISRSKLYRHIKSVSGLSIVEFIRYIRLRKAASLMMETDMQIKEIAYKVGFSDKKYFREQFHKLFQMNPSEFVNKYKNSTVESKLTPIHRLSKKSNSLT